MRTGFEHLEALLAHQESGGCKMVSIQGVKEAMIRDWHLLFHDAAWSDGCPICDKERASE